MLTLDGEDLDELDAALGELRSAGWPAPEDPGEDDDDELDGRDLICDRLVDEVGWIRRLFHQLVLDGADNAKRPVLKLTDVNEAEGESVPRRNPELAAGQFLQGPAPVPWHSMMALELGLVEVLKGVPEVREHLVARRRLLAPLLCQPPGPPLHLVSRPDQRLLLRPLLAETPGKVERVRAPLPVHPLVGATEAVGLPPNLADTLHLAHNRLGPHLDERPASLLSCFHSVTVGATRRGLHPHYGPGACRHWRQRPLTNDVV